MPEQPPKSICEICGGTHATIEHDTIAQSPPHEIETTELVKYKKRQALEKKTQFAERVREFADKFDFEPSRWAIHSATARLLAREGRYQEAQTLFNEIQGETVPEGGVTIVSGEEYRKALSEIIVAMARDNRMADIDNVIEQAAARYKPDWGQSGVSAAAYEALAGFLTSEHRFEEAKNVIEKMKGFTSQQARALSNVALAEARSGEDPSDDFEKAINLTQENAGIGIGPDELPTVASNMVRADMIVEAKGLEKRVYKNSIKEGARHRELVTNSDTPVYGWISTLQSPDGKWYAVDRAIAHALVEIGHIDEAQTLMNEKKFDNDDSSKLLKEIAISQAKSGKDPSTSFEKAKSEVTKIKDDPGTQVRLLSEIAFAESMVVGSDPIATIKEAKKLVKNIDLLYWQAEASGYIAKTLVHIRGSAEAVTYIESLDPYSRKIALNKIISTLAEAGQYDEAMTMTKKLDPESQPYALISILDAMANESAEIE